MWKGAKRTAEQAQQDALDKAHGFGLSGGALATIISAMALLFSGYSFYESVLRAPDIRSFVPPEIAYTDPDRPDSPFEVFIIPVTFANDGARSGVVLSVDLKVSNPRTRETKTFYAAQIGAWGETPVRAFAPISLAGRESTSQAVQFFPRMNEKVARVLDFEAGDYDFELTLNTAKSSGALLFDTEKKTQPLQFNRRIEKLDYRNFNGNGTMNMWAADYAPAASK